jgi:hypothetical protein
MRPVTLPVSEYAPDLPDYPGQGSSVILNVYPRTPVSYGPVNSPMPQYNALGSRCIGGAAFRLASGDTFMLAGTETDLYLLKAGLTSWQNASNTPGGYSGTDQVWRFTYFNGDVIATNFGNNPQYITLSSGSTFTDLPGSPPRGKFVGVAKNAFVVFAHTFDSLNGEMPQRVWWGAAGNARSWPTLGSAQAQQVQSSAVDLLGPDGAIAGIAFDLNGADAVVFQEYALRRMMYSGPPNVFSFLPVERGRGCIAPDSIVAYGGIAYYWGTDGIYAFDGSESKAIGANRIDSTVYNDLDLGNVARVVGVADPINKLIWWAYPSKQNTDGNPDRMLSYNWSIDRWSLCEVTCETLLRLLTIGYSLDDLFTVFGYTIDNTPANFDGAVWQGGRVNLGLFDANHTLNFLTGTPLAATVDTQEMEPMPGRRSFIGIGSTVKPLVDGGSPTVAIGRRDKLQDAVAFTAAASMNALGLCPLRTSGRYMRSRINVPASDQWSHISGVELELAGQGVR